MTLIKSVIKIKSHKNKYKSHKNKVSHTDFNNNQHVLPFTGKDWRTNRWSIHQAKYTQMNSLRHTSSHLAERLISHGGGELISTIYFYLMGVKEDYLCGPVYSKKCFLVLLQSVLSVENNINQSGQDN